MTNDTDIPSFVASKDPTDTSAALADGKVAALDTEKKIHLDKENAKENPLPETDNAKEAKDPAKSSEPTESETEPENSSENTPADIVKIAESIVAANKAKSAGDGSNSGPKSVLEEVHYDIRRDIDDDEASLVDIDKTNEETDLTCTSIAGKNGKAFFPMKLHDIVSDETSDDIIKWLPGGKAFMIVDKKKFAQDILPNHFQQSQFTSFTRKLSRWRFTRVPRGPFIGAYYNKLFLKGHRSLCWHMRCKNENTGKTTFGSQTADTIREMSVSHGIMQSNLPAPGLAMAFPQSYLSPIHLSQQFAGGFSGMPGHGLNNQILAIEGRIMDLQNARSVGSYSIYDQQKAFMAQQELNEALATQAQQARMMSLGMNGMMDYSNAFGALRQQQQNPPTPGDQKNSSNKSTSQSQMPPF